MLGQEVSRQLQKKAVDVHRCDKNPVAVPEGQHFRQCDLSDLEALTEAAKGCDTIVHLGGVSGPGFVFDPPIAPGVVAATNITGTMNVLEAAKASGVKRVVFASSVIVYWPVDRERAWPEEELVEGRTDVLDSTETYGASKIAGEQLCRAYAAMNTVDTVSLRIGWVYGPGRTTGCVIRAMLEGIPMDTPPQHKRDHVYVTDAAEALVLAALREKPFQGVALNVSGGHITQLAVEGAVHWATGKPCQRAASKETVDPAIPPMSLRRIEAELGWRPRVGIAEGVRLYAEHLGLAGPRQDPGLDKYLGTWCFDVPTSENALGYYKFWGTLTDEEAQECSVSMKKMSFSAMSENGFSMVVRAADTTRNNDFVCEVRIDGTPQMIPEFFRKNANNSIKMNPTGKWWFWWDGGDLMQEMNCVVRDKPVVHSLKREIKGNILRCIELVTDSSGEVLCQACLGFKRDDAEPPAKKARGF